MGVTLELRDCTLGEVKRLDALDVAPLDVTCGAVSVGSCTARGLSDALSSTKANRHREAG